MSKRAQAIAVAPICRAGGAGDGPAHLRNGQKVVSYKLVEVDFEGYL